MTGVVRPPRRWSLALFAAAYDRFDQDDGEGLSAGLAFGALLSIAPLLLVILGIASFVLGEGAAREQIEDVVGQSLGHRSVTLVRQLITDASAWSGGASLLGSVLFLLGSARLVGLVDGALRRVFDVPTPAHQPTLLERVRLYFTIQLRMLAVTLTAGVLMVASIVLRTLGASVLRGDVWLDAAWMIGREGLSFLAWTLALALVYWALPRIRLHRGDIFAGALVSALLVEAVLIVLHVGASAFDFGAAYGAAGAILGTLVALYVVSQFFVFGAEITAELASRRDEGVRSAHLREVQATSRDGRDADVG